MGKMIRAIFSVTQNNIKKLTFNPRMYLSLVLLVTYLHSRVVTLRSFCEFYRVKITPYLFPYVMSDDHVVLVFTLVVMLMLCDAPFIDLDQPYIVMRSGRKNWVLGQFLYIYFLCLCLTAFLFCSLLLLFFPHLEFSGEWGKAISTLVQTSAANEFGVTIPFDRYIYLGYSPISATLLSLFLCFSVSAFLGSLLFYLNFRVNRMMGILVCSLFILWQLVISKTNIELIRFSPVSWLKLGEIDVNGTTVYPNLEYALGVLFALLILFVCLSLFHARKTDIDVIKSV